MSKWELVRERDGLTKQSKGVKWIEWNEDGTFKDYVTIHHLIKED